jgi:hypothetical protein
MSLDAPTAKIAFFDTYKELDLMTELMGITKEGAKGSPCK